MQFDIESLTLNDIDDIEEVTGMTINEIEDSDDRPKGKLLKALAWIIKRKDDPAFTLDMAGEMSLPEVMELIGTEDEGTDSPN